MLEAIIYVVLFALLIQLIGNVINVLQILLYIVIDMVRTVIIFIFAILWFTTVFILILWTTDENSKPYRYILREMIRTFNHVCQYIVTGGIKDISASTIKKDLKMFYRMATVKLSDVVKDFFNNCICLIKSLWLFIPATLSVFSIDAYRKKHIGSNRK